MPLYYHREQLFRLSEDVSHKLKLAEREKEALDDDTSYTLADGGRMQVTDADGEVTVDLGSLASAKFLFLESDEDVNVKLDAAVIALRPDTANNRKARITIEQASFAALTVQVPTAATTANITITVAGA